MKKVLLSALALGVSLSAFALGDDVVIHNDKQLKLAPCGRILMDAAAYTSNASELFPAGVAITDVRAGFKAQYGKWDAQAELGFAYAKVSPKNVFIQYNFNEHNALRAGYFIYQYGLQSSTSSSMKTEAEEPIIHSVMHPGRLLGLQYNYNKGDYFASVGAYCGAENMEKNTTQLRKSSYGAVTRLAWRPWRGAENDCPATVQLGFSLGVSAPTNNWDHIYNDGADFPTRVAKVRAVGGDVDQVSTVVKFTPDLLLAKGPFALETGYYWMNMSRRLDALKSYTSYGAYCTLRALAIGGDYEYSSGNVALGVPKPKSLEFALSYCYVNTSSNKAGIYGGRAQDLSLTANWYINKYMVGRIRCAYTYRFDRWNDPDINLGAFQARLMCIF